MEHRIDLKQNAIQMCSESSLDHMSNILQYSALSSVHSQFIRSLAKPDETD